MLDIMRKCVFRNQLGSDIAFMLEEHADLWDSLSVNLSDNPKNVNTEDEKTIIKSTGFCFLSSTGKIGTLYGILNQFRPTSVSIEPVGHDNKVTVTW
jgi:hypothetical protein